MIDERRAIEALRAGVPNRSAIRLLGTAETDITGRFTANLGACPLYLESGRQARGQIVAGGFGAGKSHLLGALQELALERDFIVSRVTISKETPLFDLGKLYSSALRNGLVPGRNDDVMTAVMARLRPTTEAYGRLEQWTTAQGEDFSALFPALLHLIPHPQTTQERLQQIGRFFAGGRLGLATVKQWLRESGAGKLFPLKPLKEAELARQRLYFLPRLIAAAGFRGWCILFDEAELIGRYGIIQRGRSYAELARWLGADRTVEIPGLVSVVAFTDDFTEAVIVDRRDEEIVPTRLLARGDRALAVLATTGMDVIRNEQILLRPPDAIVLQATLEKTRALYAGAYGWPPPATPIGQRMAAKSMRQYIKSWITEWDLRRLYGRAGDIDSDTIVTSYAEDPAIEQPTEEPGEATEA